MVEADYYIHESSDDWKAVERWENEGGRQRHDLSLDSIGEDDLRRREQAVPTGKLGEPDNIAYAMLFLASDGVKRITGQTQIVDGGRTWPASVSAV